MRLALIRQRYNPYGGAERFVARAVEALKGQGVAVTVFARDWNTSGDTSGDAPGNASVQVSGEGVTAELVRCDPFYVGRLWRDASFAHAACRAVAR